MLRVSVRAQGVEVAVGHQSLLMSARDARMLAEALPRLLGRHRPPFAVDYPLRGLHVAMAEWASPFEVRH